MSEKVFKNTLKALKAASKELQNNKLISDENRKELNNIIANADAPLTLLIMGEFSTGKSTFINAIVGKEIAAVGALPTTAVITKLCYGEEDKITIYFKDGKSKVYGQEEFAQITSETDDSKYKKIRKNIKYVERAMPMDILQYISLIDSPGLNALNQTHADITKEFVDNADAVLWMFSTDKAGSVTEIQAMEALNPRLKPIAIINQIDKLDPEEDDVETFLSDIKNKLKGKVLDVIGISSLMAYKGKTLGNEMLVEESNIHAVQNAMEEKVIPNRYDFKLKSLLDELGSFICGVQTDLEGFKEELENEKENNYEKYITEKSSTVETEAILEKIVLSVKDYCIEHAGLQNTPAAFVLNILYYYGLSVDKNEAKALEGLESIAIKNHYLAQAFLSIDYLNKEDYTKAFYWTKKAVEYGDKECQYALAELYFNGLGTQKNEIEAVKWYKKSAEQGFAEAQYFLANCYLNGLGVKEDKEKALNLLKKAAKQGHKQAKEDLEELQKAEKAKSLYALANKYNNENRITDAFNCYKMSAELDNAEAQNMTGMCYYEGIGVGKNEKEAIKWYKKAAKQGLAVAQYNLAHLIACYFDGNGVVEKDSEAFKWYKEAAEQGLAEAQNMLGYCYENGFGVTKNEAEAINWYYKAAEQGQVNAKHNLAVCYFYGRGLKEDKAKAVKWFTKAAERGFASAQNWLGHCYENGLGVTKNEAEAINWYYKAAEQGNANAKYNLANCYLNGIGVLKNNAEAVKWYTKAAEQGYAEAQNMLGRCYEEGVGASKNETEAVKWYTKAAEQGYAEAQNMLGRCYEEGVGVSKNELEAIKWYKKAAEQGLAAAQYNLANLTACYFDGDSVVENETEAFKWYKKAAEQGLAPAQYKTGLYYNRGWGVKKDESEAFKWCQKAAEQGLAVAQYNLAECFFLW